MEDKNTKTVGVVLPTAMATDLESRADSLHLSTSKYVRMVLNQWIKSGRKITLSEK